MLQSFATRAERVAQQLDASFILFSEYRQSVSDLLHISDGFSTINTADDGNTKGATWAFSMIPLRIDVNVGAPHDITGKAGQRAKVKTSLVA
jgi:hypothetical protein